MKRGWEGGDKRREIELRKEKKNIYFDKSEEEKTHIPKIRKL